MSVPLSVSLFPTFLLSPIVLPPPPIITLTPQASLLCPYLADPEVLCKKKWSFCEKSNNAKMLQIKSKLGTVPKYQTNKHKEIAKKWAKFLF